VCFYIIFIIDNASKNIANLKNVVNAYIFISIFLRQYRYLL